MHLYEHMGKMFLSFTISEECYEYCNIINVYQRFQWGKSVFVTL